VTMIAGNRAHSLEELYTVKPLSDGVFLTTPHCCPTRNIFSKREKETLFLSPHPPPPPLLLATGT
jgi:hypothetical protein